MSGLLVYIPTEKKDRKRHRTKTDDKNLYPSKNEYFVHTPEEKRKLLAAR